MFKYKKKKRRTNIDRYGASVQYPDFLLIHLSHSAIFCNCCGGGGCICGFGCGCCCGVVAVVFVVVTTIVVPLTFLIVARFILFEESGRFPTEISV